MLPFLAAFSGCFQQGAPERINTADTIYACLEARNDLQFAHLTAEAAPLAEFPSELAQCPSLWKLSLRGQTALAPLSDAISDLRGLRWLDLSEMGLAQLPDALSALPLQRIYLSDNAFETLPHAIAGLASLDYLNLDRNRLTSLPPETAAWTSLRWLRLNNNRLESLPDSAAAWTSLRRLYLRNNRLKSLPEAITSLPTLEHLDLGHNSLMVSLPDSIGNLTSLTRLDLDYTDITNLPPSIANLKNLQHLVIYNTRISTNDYEHLRAILPPTCKIEY